MMRPYRPITTALSGFNLTMMLGAIASSASGTSVSVVLAITSIGFTFSVCAWFVDQFDDDFPGKGLSQASLLIGFVCAVASCTVLIALKSQVASAIFVLSVLSVMALVGNNLYKIKHHLKATNNPLKGDREKAAAL